MFESISSNASSSSNRFLSRKDTNSNFGAIPFRRPRAASVGRSMKERQEADDREMGTQNRHRHQGVTLLQRSYSVEETVAETTAPNVVARTRTPLRAGRWPPEEGAAAGCPPLVPPSPRPPPPLMLPKLDTTTAAAATFPSPRAGRSSSSSTTSIKSPSSALKNRLNRHAYNIFGSSPSCGSSEPPSLQFPGTPRKEEEQAAKEEEPPKEEPPQVQGDDCNKGPSVKDRMRAFARLDTPKTHNMRPPKKMIVSSAPPSPSPSPPLPEQQQQQLPPIVKPVVNGGVATAFLAAIQQQQQQQQKTSSGVFVNGGGVPEIIPDEDTESVSMLSSTSVETPSKKNKVMNMFTSGGGTPRNHSKQSEWDKLVDDRVRVKLLEMERRMEGRLQVALEEVELRMQAHVKDLEKRILAKSASSRTQF